MNYSFIQSLVVAIGMVATGILLYTLVAYGYIGLTKKCFSWFLPNINMRQLLNASLVSSCIVVIVYIIAIFVYYV
jgi:hypothetical protein